ncbi:MAG TPA: universal stress protein [Gammaproteobacteria bacterium]|nr:universal stress protein [Gammaproteobacteria bacterium]
MHKKILVLAGSMAGSDRAIRRAASIARRAGAAVELYGVVYDPHLEGYLGHVEIYAPLRDRLVKERRAALEAAAKELARQGTQASVEALWTYPASEAVARESVNSGADLVVMEPQGQGGKLAQDDFRLISMCPLPVLVARGDDAVYASIVAAVDPSRSRGKPAGLDEAIVAAAKGMSDLFGARLELLHCYSPVAELAADAAFDGVLIADVQGALEADRREDVERLAEQAGLPPGCGVVVRGRPSDVLADRAASEGASLIVLGTVSRGPIRRFLLGSTAERVLGAEGGDVLVVKPPGFHPD